MCNAVMVTHVRPVYIAIKAFPYLILSGYISSHHSKRGLHLEALPGNAVDEKLKVKLYSGRYHWGLVRFCLPSIELRPQKSEISQLFRLKRSNLSFEHRHTVIQLRP